MPVNTQEWKVRHGLFVGSNYTKDAHLDKQTRKLYRCWRSMKSRCSDPNAKAYKDYGARGIKVCPEWEADFEAFMRDMGFAPSPKHSIGRIKNHLGYSKDNCRWETMRQQSQNRRSTIFITIGEATKCPAEWARDLNISSTAFLYRMKKTAKETWLMPRANKGPKPQKHVL